MSAGRYNTAAAVSDNRSLTTVVVIGNVTDLLHRREYEQVQRHL